MSNWNIQSLFCARLACPPEEYEERMFHRCLTWQARLAAPWLRRLKPGFFETDLRLIRDLGLAASPQDIKASVGYFRKRNQAAAGSLRISLKLRVSGRKATLLARQLLARPNTKAPESATGQGRAGEVSDVGTTPAMRAALVLDARRKRPTKADPAVPG